MREEKGREGGRFPPKLAPKPPTPGHQSPIARVATPASIDKCKPPARLQTPSGLITVLTAASGRGPRRAALERMRLHAVVCDLACSPISQVWACIVRDVGVGWSSTVEDPSVPGRFWLHHCLYSANVTPLPGSVVRRFQASACGADFTGDGVANGSDVAAFGEYYAQGAPEADFVPDEIINSDDILEYLAVGLP